MGSILAETIEAESIDRLVKPVKDLFGAIFFVSVGMMVDPAMIIEYAIPIIVITIAVILGQATFGTFGVILSGKPLKTAMQCGFSLTQIGEFAFIIASLGVSLHVTSDFLYPIVVAVSVITTFLTPYMIRLAEPASSFVDAHLPASWRKFLMRYSSGSQTVLNHENLWKKLLLAMVRITVVYSIVSISIIALSFRFVVPFFKENLPHFWASLLGAVFIILCISPFLRAIMVKKNHSVEFMTLWHDNRANRAPLVSTIVIRIMIAALFVIFVISGLFKASIGLIIGVAVLAVLLMVWSRRLKKQSILIERRFFQNLRSREVRAEYLGEKKPEYAGRLLSHDLHLADLEIPGESTWAGKTLMELNLGKKYGIHIASILRGKRRINIPGGSVRLFPMDKIQVIGTDEQLNVFSSAMQSGAKIDWEMYEKGEMTLKQFIIDADSVFLGKTIRESGIRDKYHCMIAGVEREDGTLMVPDVNAPFEEGENNETLHNLMIEVAQLSVSRVFLFKEQTYRGRCLVAYKDHVNDLNELSDEDRNAFMADVARVTRAMQKAFQPEKINYGAYSDKLSHLHFHLAPKYVDGPDYGGVFQMNPGKVYLTDAEYQELIDAVKANL